MSLSISFELTDRDLQFFRRALRQSREAVKDENAETILISAEIEAQIAELEDPEERQAFLEELGLEETTKNGSCPSPIASACWQLLFISRTPKIFFLTISRSLVTWTTSSLSNSLRVSYCMYAKPTRTSANFAKNTKRSTVLMSTR